VGEGRIQAYPAAERNKGPIAEALAGVLPAAGTVLEVASGVGQHAEHLARAYPSLVWQPSEREEELREAIDARVRAAHLPNLVSAVHFDVLSPTPPLQQAAAMLCVNMIHVAPWPATVALFRQAASMLVRGAPLVLYGPFMRGGTHTARSNAEFDASLRARNAEWGLRDLDDVAEAASAHGLRPADLLPMPANNFTAVFRRAG
jgi:hypothetical protein